MCKCSIEAPNLIQLDGNISTDSILQDDDSSVLENNPPSAPPPPVQNLDKITAALSLPKVATYNLRSLFPKIGNLTTDILKKRNRSFVLYRNLGK